MAVIDRTQVAVLYETVTGTNQARAKVVVVGSETFDVGAFLAVNPHLGAILVPSNQPYDDASCRQAIATQLGMALLDGTEDRCVQIDASGTVVSVDKGNVAGLDQPDAGNTLITSALADIGDVWTGSVFNRRWAVFNVATGFVMSIANVAVGGVVRLLAGESAIPSLTLQVGDTYTAKVAVPP